MFRAALVLLAAFVTAPAGAQTGKAAWFSGARAPGEFADPRALLWDKPHKIVRGDVLEYRRLAPTVAASRAGLELQLDDGSRISAAPVTTNGTWEQVRVPLDRHAGRRVERIELTAHGFEPGVIAFAIDEAAFVRDGGSRVPIFDEELGPQAAEGEFACIVAAPVADGVASVVADVAVAEPWAALPLEPRPGPTDLCGGVPRQRSMPEPLRARRLALAPIEGGRAYELVLFVESSAAEPIELTLRAFGLDAQKRAITFTVPAANTPPPLGAGFVDGAVACVVVPIACEFAIAGLELPAEPRVTLHAASARWRRGGSANAPQFRAAWIAREGRAKLGGAAREALETWARERLAARIFRIARPDSDEQAMERALLAGDLAGFESAVQGALSTLRTSAAALRECRATFAWSAVESGALRATLARLEADPSSCAFGGLPADLEALRRDDAKAFARLCEHESSGRWTTFGWPYARNEHATSTLEGWLASCALARGSDARSPASLTRAWLDEALGERPELPAALARLRVGAVFAFANDALPREPFAAWTSPQGSVAALRAVPSDASAAGADALPWGLWSDLVAAGRGARDVLVALDATSPRADQDRAFVAFLERCETAPRVQFAALDRFLGEARGRNAPAQSLAPRAVAALEERGLADDARALRAARSALAIEASAAALASLDGLADDHAPRIEAQRALELDPTASRASAVASQSRERTRRALDVVALACDTRGSGVPLLAFNPLPWSRRALLELADARLSLTDARGRPLATQASASGGLVLEIAVPGLGVAGARVAQGARDDAASASSGVEAFDLGFESAEARAAFDASTFGLASLRFGQGEERLSGPTFVAWSDGTAVERLQPVEPARLVERGPLRAVATCVLGSSHARVELEMALDRVNARIEVRAKASASSGRVRFVIPVRGTQPTTIATAVGRAGLDDDPRALHAASSWFARGGLAVLAGSVGAFSCPPNALSIELEPGREIEFALAAFDDAVDVAALERERPFQPFAADVHDGARSLPRETLELRGGVVRVASIETVNGGRAWRLVLGERARRASTLVLESALPVFGARAVDLDGRVLRELDVQDRQSLEIPIAAGALGAFEIDLAP